MYGRPSNALLYTQRRTDWNSCHSINQPLDTFARFHCQLPRLPSTPSQIEISHNHVLPNPHDRLACARGVQLACSCFYLFLLR